MQSTPDELIQDLLGVIRSQFYADAGPKKWAQDLSFVRKHVVLWPASWLNSRGVTLRPDRYRDLVLGVLNEVKRHGQTGAVRYWPGYLKHCLQEHFRHHGDEVYAEAKSMRTTLETAMLAARSRVSDQPGRQIQELANAYRLATLPARRQKRRQTQFAQPLLAL